MTLSQDNRATRHYTHLTHTLIIKLRHWFLQTAAPPNTHMHTQTLCFFTISSVCGLFTRWLWNIFNRTSAAFYNINKEMFGVIILGIWQSACPFKHLALPSPLLVQTRNVDPLRVINIILKGFYFAGLSVLAHFTSVLYCSESSTCTDTDNYPQIHTSWTVRVSASGDLLLTLAPETDMYKDERNKTKICVTVEGLTFF